MFADQVKEVLGDAKVQMGEENEGSKNSGARMAIPTTFGGLAGEPLHFLSVG